MPATVIYQETPFIPVATQSQKGIVSVTQDYGLVISDGTVSVVPASNTVYGTVKVGNGLSASNGLLSVVPAAGSQLGAVRPDGTTITVDADGTIHGAQTYDYASQEEAVAGEDSAKLMTPSTTRAAIQASREPARCEVVEDDDGNLRFAFVYEEV